MKINCNQEKLKVILPKHQNKKKCIQNQIKLDRVPSLLRCSSSDFLRTEAIRMSKFIYETDKLFDNLNRGTFYPE